MKSKKIKKLSKLIVSEANLQREKRQTKVRYESPTPIAEEPTNIRYITNDPKISLKFFNFILNLIKIKDRISFKINENSINIYGDMNELSTPSTQSKSRLKSKEDDIRIEINPNGFLFSQNYSNEIAFADTTMLQKIKPILIKKDKEVSIEIASNFIDDIMVKSNLSRDNNLDEILK